MLITIPLVAAALCTGQILALAFFNLCFSFSAEATTTKGCVPAACLQSSPTPRTCVIRRETKDCILVYSGKTGVNVGVL